MWRVMGSVGFFSPLWLLANQREEEKKRDVGWRASLETRGFFHSRRERESGALREGSSFSAGGFR